MKNTAYEQNLCVLLRQFGTYSSAARYMGILPRSFRTQRKKPNPKAAQRIAATVRQLRLRKLIHVLRRDYGVSDSVIAQAMRQADRELGCRD
jgi:hypothetical protein